MASIGLVALQAGSVMNVSKAKRCACFLVLAALTSLPGYADSVFDGSNADLWLIDAEQGRVSGYNLDKWLEQFAPDNVPVFPLSGNQQALINNLSNSSLPMSPNQP